MDEQITEPQEILVAQCRRRDGLSNREMNSEDRLKFKKQKAKNVHVLAQTLPTAFPNHLIK